MNVCMYVRECVSVCVRMCICVFVCLYVYNVCHHAAIILLTFLVTRWKAVTDDISVIFRRTMAEYVTKAENSGSSRDFILRLHFSTLIPNDPINSIPNSRNIAQTRLEQPRRMLCLFNYSCNGEQI